MGNYKRAHNAKDWSGFKSHYWTVVKYVDTTKDRKPRYLCKCDCGHETTKVITTILNGESKSCGCRNAKNHRKHGMCGTRVYNIWQCMKSRCMNPKSTQYKWYGGRGISISKDWVNDFAKFYADMGDPPTDKHTIDRIDNDSGYSKSNCKWSTMKEQSNNRRSNKQLPQPPTDKD